MKISIIFRLLLLVALVPAHPTTADGERPVYRVPEEPPVYREPIVIDIQIPEQHLSARRTCGWGMGDSANEPSTNGAMVRRPRHPDYPREHPILRNSTIEILEQNNDKNSVEVRESGDQVSIRVSAFRKSFCIGPIGPTSIIRARVTLHFVIFGCPVLPQAPGPDASVSSAERTYLVRRNVMICQLLKKQEKQAALQYQVHRVGIDSADRSLFGPELEVVERRVAMAQFRRVVDQAEQEAEAFVAELRSIGHSFGTMRQGAASTRSSLEGMGARINDATLDGLVALQTELIETEQIRLRQSRPLRTQVVEVFHRMEAADLRMHTKLGDLQEWMENENLAIPSLFDDGLAMLAQTRRALIEDEGALHAQIEELIARNNQLQDRLAAAEASDQIRRAYPEASRLREERLFAERLLVTVNRATQLRRQLDQLMPLGPVVEAQQEVLQLDRYCGSLGSTGSHRLGCRRVISEATRIRLYLRDALRATAVVNLRLKNSTAADMQALQDAFDRQDVALAVRIHDRLLGEGVTP